MRNFQLNKIYDIFYALNILLSFSLHPRGVLAGDREGSCPPSFRRRRQILNLFVACSIILFVLIEKLRRELFVYRSWSELSH